MLRTWNPENIKPMIPFCAAMVGNRRSGKSFLQFYVLDTVLKDEFDLYISFCGSVSCSPDLRRFFQSKGLEHLMFERVTVKFLETLMKQQEYLKTNNLGRRRILLLLDDAELDKHEQQYLGTFCTRARHFDVSIFQCSVSYTQLAKNFRRSLDILFLFQMSMYSDRKLLLQEFSSNPKLSHYAMQDLQKYQCMVQEKNFTSELFYFKIETPNQCEESKKNLELLLSSNEKDISETCPDADVERENTESVVESDQILENEFHI